MDTKQTLIAARELISDPKRWTQGTYCRDEFGMLVEVENIEQAYCFCAMAAIRKVAHINTDYNPAVSLLHELSQAEGELDGVSYYNDRRTHAEVLALFDKAIEECK